MATRAMSGPGDGRTIREVVAGLLAAELLRPGPELWLVSAWVSDLEVLDNTTRAYSSLCPDWPSGPIRLGDVLQAVAHRGGRVAVVVRDVAHNRPFLRRLESAREQVPGRIGLAVAPDAHEKCLVGTEYVFEGSMNFTLNGLTVNDEQVLLRHDREAAANRLLDLHNRWSRVLEWG